MSWRTVVITGHCKLDLKMGSMVIRSEDTKRVLLDEIAVVIVENSGVAMTGCLLHELARRKIKLILCDEKHNPAAELMPLYGSHDCSAKIRTQIAWNEEIKTAVWTEIVSEKIRQQAELLSQEHWEAEAEKLRSYLDDMEPGDASNREGHAAKVYFNALFGVTFSRSQANPINAALNYGYAILLSAVNREVCACGYLTQLGICHDNTFNPFNLSCDFMEPYRILVDRFVCQKQFGMFESKQKHEMLEIVNQVVFIDDSRQYLYHAIRIYVRSVLDALCTGDVMKIKHYRILGEDQ